MRRSVLLSIASGFLLAQVVSGTVPVGRDWPAWRGDGSGRSSETNLPIFWNATNNIAWRAALPGEGSSSPIVSKQCVFVTASTESGKKRLVLCLDAGTGAILWQRELVSDRVPKTDPKSGYAPATPVTDGEKVFVFFDSPGLVALNPKGNLLWTVPLGPFNSPYNVTGSPILYRDTVILCCDHAGEAFIMAAGKTDGKIRWRTPRKLDIQFSTPLMIEYHGNLQVVVNASTVKSYNPDDGSELWSCAGMMPMVVPSPVYDGSLVYAASGRHGPAMAIDPGGKGNIKESHVRMQVPTGGPYVPSPLACSVLVLPSDDGTLRFINGQGNVILTQRLQEHFTSSPVMAGNQIYWVAENGDTCVVETSGLDTDHPGIKVLARNPLEGGCIASPAVASSRLFIRTSNSLFCVAAGNQPTIGNAPAKIADSRSFEDLKKLFQTHPAADGPDIPVRLSVIEELASRKDPAAIEFLKTAAINDPHWDVSEAAAKTLAGYDNRATVPALLALFTDFRPYVKIIAAQALGRLGAAEAKAPLMKGMENSDPLLRIACLESLAGLVRSDAAQATEILPTLLACTQDKEGTVRAAAFRSLVEIQKQSGNVRDRIVEAILRSAADPNPLVRNAAEFARKAYGIKDESGKTPR